MLYRHYGPMITSAALAASLLMTPSGRALAQDQRPNGPDDRSIPRDSRPLDQNMRTITLDAGTVIPVKLTETLSSTDAHKGDRFEATLQNEDAARSLGLPIGTYIQGTVAAVHPMHDHDPGVLSLNFGRIVLPNEMSVPIHGSLIGLDNKSVKRSDNGRLVAQSDTRNKTLMYAGYGAGAGLLLGAVTHGNTIFDTLLGGGLGALFGNLDKSHGDPRDVVLKPGTEMGVRLDRTADFRTYDDRNAAPGSYHRTERSQDGAAIAGDPNRDPYDAPSSDRSGQPENATYEILNRYTDLTDNGQPIRVRVNGRRVTFLDSARPFIVNGVLMVPAVAVLRADHDKYSYTSTKFMADGPGESLTAKFDSRYVTGSSTHRYKLPAQVQRRNGTVYVPMQFLAIVTGQDLRFDRDSQTMELGAAPDDASNPNR